MTMERHVDSLPTFRRVVAVCAHPDDESFGLGAVIATFVEQDTIGGGAVDLVDLDEVTWTDPPEREEAGSPNVVGATQPSTSSTGSAGTPSSPTTGNCRHGSVAGSPRLPVSPSSARM